MKKYLQIIVVLGAFFLLVYLKNLPIRHFGEGEDDGPTTIGTPQQNALVTQAPNPPLTPNTTVQAGAYKDGTYTGSVEDAVYGNYQVAAVISGGKLVDINFLQYPNDNRTSLSINTQAMPILKSEALTAQSANVDIVSGASDSSPAFSRSLANALLQAK